MAITISDFDTRQLGKLFGGSDVLLNTILQIFPDFLFCLDENGNLLNFREKDGIHAFSQTEYRFGESFLNTLPDEIAGVFREALKQTQILGRFEIPEYELITDGIRQWYSAKLLQAPDASTVIIIQNITLQKQKTDGIRQQQKLMEFLKESARQLTREMDSQTIGQQCVDSLIDQFGIILAWIGWINIEGQLDELGYATTKNSKMIGANVKPEIDKIDYLRNNKFLILDDKYSDGRLLLTKAYFPLMINNKMVGILSLVTENQGFFSPEMIDLLQAICSLTGSSIQNSHLYEDSRRQLSQMQTLRTIDQAILSNLDFHTMASIILSEAAKHIHADAIALLVLDPKSKMLNFVDGYGFRYDTFKYSHLKIGESFSGKVAQERRTIYVENLQDDPQNFSRASRFSEEGFMMYLGTPLIAHSEVRGVLEIFQRREFQPKKDWLTVLETLANQIAIAIDNSLLVKYLKDTNLELNSAYHSTIEGLSRALELRDRETQGHTLRVARMTDELALRMGLPTESLDQVHQGALLHDIGKMGIPDSILLKPSALSAEEWDIMKQHPIYAYKLLSQVENLKSAMDIPLYHHEKWDGTGYPYGLKGEQIPLAARLFSVVDVYDALTSNRPYRAAWSKEEAINYIQSQIGIYFDPTVVPVFTQLKTLASSSMVRS